jgi:hypothetical protein
MSHKKWDIVMALYLDFDGRQKLYARDLDGDMTMNGKKTRNLVQFSLRTPSGSLGDWGAENFVGYRAGKATLRDFVQDICTKLVWESWATILES